LCFDFLGKMTLFSRATLHFNLSETMSFVADLAPQQKSQHDDVSFNTQTSLGCVFANGTIL